ncbi:SDR family oxidoreductase [Nocardia sp. NEAU-G5]|uniref:3-oxoacyl-[acyl-carrier-protein] reductase MabA n=1 Tax=Nocardia albiluteola TaxID=2842303 RepID=A0ABS6B7R8_9NOCA|nr:SDR family oxidoreductase [Nocardia albiluteola]MBU3066365.1 SDR family oxidoreductase [Nocardia albiluteola]
MHTATHHRPLTGRIALVTGAARGIGAAIAHTLGIQGATVVVNYVHHRERAEEVVEMIRSSGSSAVAAQGDVTDIADARRVLRAAEELGGPDILVCNAIGPTADVRRRASVDSPEAIATIQRRVAAQLACTLNCCHLAVPAMRARGGGSIVLIGSAGARSGGAPGLADIAIAKAAQDTLGLALARELGPDGIRVNTVAPGLVATDANAGEHQQQWVEAAGAATPLRRISRPEDIAATVAMLASDAAAQITGARIDVDGGRSLG